MSLSDLDLDLAVIDLIDSNFLLVGFTCTHDTCNENLLEGAPFILPLMKNEKLFLYFF